MRLKETRLAAITMHGFLKVQTKDLFGLISDYVNINDKTSITSM